MMYFQVKQDIQGDEICGTGRDFIQWENEWVCEGQSMKHRIL